MPPYRGRHATSGPAQWSDGNAIVTHAGAGLAGSSTAATVVRRHLGAAINQLPFAFANDAGYDRSKFEL
jgi:hypothetical protein